MKPPYTITPGMLRKIASISEKLGEIKTARLVNPPTELRKRNRIKTIQSSLEIEGNTMTVDQITALIHNKRVHAPLRDITEVKNALEVYSQLDVFQVYQLDSLCNAHGMLMRGLVKHPGRLRHTPVGIMKGTHLAHMAPPGDRVFSLMSDLFEYLQHADELLLIKSCVFHYELEFIHPFEDGNGRMGRLWQTLILKEYAPVFEYLPVETLIKSRQKEYYQALELSDQAGNSTLFVEFMLDIIHTSLEELLETRNVTVTFRDRIQLFHDFIQDKSFTRKEYLRHNKEIATATASRDLAEAVRLGILIKQGEKRLTRYHFPH